MPGVESLEQELESLSPEHRAQARALLDLRAKAEVLANELDLDAGDVFHQLQQLARSPSERLRIGLAHGRLRRRIAANRTKDKAVLPALELAHQIIAKLK